VADPSYWLIKSEPAKFSFADLERDGSTVWDGVRNNQAAIYLRTMKVGDLLLYYHSVDGLEVVGIAKVSKEYFLDPSDPKGRFVAVEVQPDHRLPKPVPLSAMKAEPKLAGMAMFRQFRLSVSPVTPDEWKVILGMGGE
jgi:predicted RNA-binding protein with PUA-like domain